MKLAFSGAGWIAAVHGLAARELRLPVTLVASRSPARAAERATECGARPCRYEDLPGGADVVVVATPPSCHAADAERALAAGSAVIVEKPLCTTLADADALVDAAAAHGQRLAYAENLAYAPVVERLLALAPALGPLQHVEVRSLQARPTWGDFLTEAWGGGALFDLGVHPLAIALLLAAPAAAIEVSARLEGGDDHPTDEYGDVTLRFDSGLRARVTASWRHAATPQWDVQAASATGVLRAELLPTPALERDGNPVPLPRPRAKIAALDEYGYTGQLAAFTADFAAGRRPRMDAAFGRKVLDVVCAAYASARRDGEPEALPFTGPRDRSPWQLWRG